ncbi:hypothetical protein HYH02_014412 [Chlamydomonas schloesseri]|uniref:Uncharacterized protein n=1 Tax=Chlamydomonas schloesseri TaxID=2026947 RepID=A0A835VUE2_9CHLO|nr:hypothetical protein HYH02_014412 [Chlamydomonas schloesseri]|eukprot:KAG2428230.1 hypothetical protein HYH02_014412 [Chlamydomonas schloesseri]
MLDQQQKMLETLTSVLNEQQEVRDQQKAIRQQLGRVEGSSSKVVEAMVDWGLRELDEQQYPGSSAPRASVVLKDAPSVVSCVLPLGFEAAVGVLVADVLAAYLAEQHRGLRAILLEELKAVPYRLKMGPGYPTTAAMNTAQAALTALQGATSGEELTSALAAALEALQCCADRLPVSLKLLEECATDKANGKALMRGALCVAALTALHPRSGVASSSTAKQLEVDRLPPITVRLGQGPYCFGSCFGA